ncbi:MAG: hypothetical protein R3B98_09745 [Hyphomonas sp.]
MTKMTADERDDLKMWARIHIRGGYEPLEEVEEILLDYAQDFRSPLSDRDRQIEVRNALVQAVSALVQEQQNWPILTDFDRLELAFDMLEDDGIVARQHFTCCGTCGASEIGAEIDDFEDLGRAAKGYAFFHQQDTESAVESGSLYISYGAANPEASNEDCVAIGQQLFDALTKVGLKPIWDGKINHRVGLAIDWKRRWDGAMPKPIKRWFY